MKRPGCRFWDAAENQTSMAREIGRYKWATVARQILWTGADILREIRIWRDGIMTPGPFPTKRTPDRDLSALRRSAHSNCDDYALRWVLSAGQGA
mgnify:CR=1 FL=1